MYPLISDRGYVNSIELPLPDITHAWIGASILFFGIASASLLCLLFPKNGEKKEEKPYLLLLGVMCLGLMIYYINRPVEGSLFIVLFLMLILQTVILQKSQNIYLEWKDTRQTTWNINYQRP